MVGVCRKNKKKCKKFGCSLHDHFSGDISLAREAGFDPLVGQLIQVASDLRH